MLQRFMAMFCPHLFLIVALAHFTSIVCSSNWCVCLLNSGIFSGVMPQKEMFGGREGLCILQLLIKCLILG